jgi:hypothetical protein
VACMWESMGASRGLPLGMLGLVIRKLSAEDELVVLLPAEVRLWGRGSGAEVGEGVSDAHRGRNCARCALKRARSRRQRDKGISTWLVAGKNFSLRSVEDMSLLIFLRVSAIFINN